METVTIPASWHGDPRFYELWKRMGEIHSKKNHDYAGIEDALRNFRECEQIGIPAWKGAFVRFQDKYRRLVTFVKQEAFEVGDESFEDTCIDGANYLLLVAVLFEEAKEAEKRTLKS